MNNKYFDLIIIGGGVSGVFASLNIGDKYSVCLLEKNKNILKKFLITGHGKSNIANNSQIDDFLKNLIGSNKFLYPSLTKFNGNDILKFLDANNIKYYQKEPHRFHLLDSNNYFKDIILKLLSNKKNLFIKCNSNVIDVFKKTNDELFNVVLDNNEILTTKHLIIATGGLSFKNTGSTGFGFEIAKKFNHNIKPFFPIGVGLYINDNNLKKLQGISIDNVKISVNYDTKLIYSEMGSLMFTHYGIGGPVVRRVSGYISYGLLNKNNVSIEINFFDKEDIENELNNNKNLINCFKSKNKKLINYLLDNMDLNLDLKNISKDLKQKIINLLTKSTYEIKQTDSIDVAINTGGGIDLKQINPNTFESKVVKNLFFIGELIDINPRTNGFNITSYASMAYSCINFINSKY